MNNRSLRLHLTITFAIVALIPILVLGTIQVRQIKQITTDYNNTQMQTTYRLADAVQTYVYYYRNAVETLATTISASGTSFRNREGLTLKLQSVKNTLPGFQRLYVADRSGIVTAQYPDFPATSSQMRSLLGTDLSSRDYVQAMGAKGSTTLSPLIRVPEAGHDDLPVLAIATPVYSDQKQFDGFVVAILDIQAIESLVTKYDYGSGAYPVVLDASGKAVYHPNSEIVASLADLSGEPVAQDAMSRGQGLGKYHSAIFKQDELVTYNKIEDLGWTVWVSRSYGVANAAFLSSLKTTFLLLILTLVLTVIVGTLLAKRLNNPIHVLVGYTQRLANGILGEPESRIMPKGAPYELQMLADHFFQMGRQMTANQQALIELNSKLESRVAERTQSLSRKNQELEIVNALLTPAAAHPSTNEIMEDSVLLLRELTQVAVRLRLYPHTGSSALGDFQGWEGMTVPSQPVPGQPADLVIPVCAGNAKLGELSVSSTSEMTEADRKFLHTFANTAAVILQNDILLSSIRHERATLNAVLESMSDAIVLVDTRHNVVYANRSMTELFHIPLKQLLAMTEETLFDTILEKFPERKEQFAEWTAKQRTPAKFKMLNEQGKERYVLISAFEVSGEDKTFGRGYVWRDITKEHEIDMLKNDLISLASHEFKTPITSIKGGVETLLRPDAQWEESFKRELLEGIHEDIGRIQDLIDDWLDISKIEAGAMRIERQPLRIRTVIENAIRRLPQHTSLGDAAFEIELEDGLPLLYADKSRMEQVFVNLFNNAIRYNRNRPHIRITAESDASYVIVCVQDNGIGISDEDLTHIFDRFYRVDVSSSRQTGGTGLGLAICEGIMKAHGGHIHAESVQGEGSTFSIFIPRFYTEDGDPHEIT